MTTTRKEREKAYVEALATALESADKWGWVSAERERGHTTGIDGSFDLHKVARTMLKFHEIRPLDEAGEALKKTAKDDLTWLGYECIEGECSDPLDASGRDV